MGTECMTYSIRKMGDLFNEIYEITLQKGDSPNSVLTWEESNINAALGQISSAYDNNRDFQEGHRPLIIQLKGRLSRNKNLAKRVRELEIFANRRNGHENK